jgi:hypothetical protein
MNYIMTMMRTESGAKFLMEYVLRTCDDVSRELRSCTLAIELAMHVGMDYHLFMAVISILQGHFC